MMTDTFFLIRMDPIVFSGKTCVCDPHVTSLGATKMSRARYIFFLLLQCFLLYILTYDFRYSQCFEDMGGW